MTLIGWLMSCDCILNISLVNRATQLQRLCVNFQVHYAGVFYKIQAEKRRQGDKERRTCVIILTGNTIIFKSAIMNIK